MNEKDEIDDLIDDLVSLGALIKSGVDEYGDPVYNINSERMKEVYPSFYDLFMEEVDEVMISLIEKGLVDVEYDEQLNAYFSITPEGKKVLEESGFFPDLYDI
jgi:hypothetical protein